MMVTHHETVALRNAVRLLVLLLRLLVMVIVMVRGRHWSCLSVRVNRVLRSRQFRVVNGEHLNRWIDLRRVQLAG